MTRHLADIAVGKIRVPDDTIREADEASVEMLAGMMAEEGQAQPIEVGVEGDGFVLVFGLHRLLASRKNKWKTIEALVDAEDGDPAARRRRAIHENLGRNELIKLDRATHIAELHRLLQEASPRRKRGGDRRSADFKGQTPAFGLTEAVAARVGLSESVIKEAVAITHGLSPAIRRRIIKVPALAKLAGKSGV